MSLVPRSPLVGKLWPGDIVMLLDGESTAHMTPDEAQKRLDDSPGVEHSLLVCAEEEEVGDHDPPELVGQVGTATMWWSPATNEHLCTSKCHDCTACPKVDKHAPKLEASVATTPPRGEGQ